MNIKELLDDAAEEVGGKLLLDFQDRMGDRIQVFLEWFNIAFHKSNGNLFWTTVLFEIEEYEILLKKEIS